MRISTLVNILIIPLLAACANSVTVSPNVSSTSVPTAANTITLVATIEPTQTYEQAFLAGFDELTNPYSFDIRAWSESKNLSPGKKAELLASIPIEQRPDYVAKYVQEVGLWNRLKWALYNYDLGTESCIPGQYIVLDTNGIHCENPIGNFLGTHISTEENKVYLDINHPEEKDPAVRQLLEVVIGRMDSMQERVEVILSEMAYTEFIGSFGIAPNSPIGIMKEDLAVFDIYRKADNALLRRTIFRPSDIKQEFIDYIWANPEYEYHIIRLGGLSNAGLPVVMVNLDDINGDDIFRLLYLATHELTHNIEQNYPIGVYSGENISINESVAYLTGIEITIGMLQKYYPTYTMPFTAFSSDVQLVYNSNGSIKPDYTEANVTALFEVPEVFELRVCSGTLSNWFGYIQDDLTFKDLSADIEACYAGR